MKNILSFNDFLNENNLAQNLTNSTILSPSWGVFLKLVLKFFPPKQNTNNYIKEDPYPELIGKHMLYLPHQQGPSGAAKLFNILKTQGNVKLDNNLRYKLLKNIPSSSKYYKNVKTGDSIQAVSSFLKYQKETWDEYQKNAMKLIAAPKNKKVRDALMKINNRKLPLDFLATVAFKESSFNINPKTNRSYVGLFQIGDAAWKQLKIIYGSKYKGTKPPIDPFKNAQAGHDYLNHSYEEFEKLIK